MQCAHVCVRVLLVVTAIASSVREKKYSIFVLKNASHQHINGWQRCVDVWVYCCCIAASEQNAFEHVWERACVCASEWVWSLNHTVRDLLCSMVDRSSFPFYLLLLLLLSFLFPSLSLTHTLTHAHTFCVFDLLLSMCHCWWTAELTSETKFHRKRRRRRDHDRTKETKLHAPMRTHRNYKVKGQCGYCVWNLDRKLVLINVCETINCLPIGQINGSSRNSRNNMPYSVYFVLSPALAPQHWRCSGNRSWTDTKDW